MTPAGAGLNFLLKQTRHPNLTSSPEPDTTLRKHGVFPIPFRRAGRILAGDVKSSPTQLVLPANRLARQLALRVQGGALELVNTLIYPSLPSLSIRACVAPLLTGNTAQYEATPRIETPVKRGSCLKHGLPARPSQFSSHPHLQKFLAKYGQGFGAARLKPEVGL